jgi:hypothetical protein
MKRLFIRPTLGVITLSLGALLMAYGIMFDLALMLSLSPVIPAWYGVVFYVLPPLGLCVFLLGLFLLRLYRGIWITLALVILLLLWAFLG